MAFRSFLTASNKKLSILAFFIFLSFSGYSQFSQAAHLIVSGDYEGARLYYLKVLDKDSANFSANQELGLLLLQYFDDKEAALFYLNRAIRNAVKKELLPELYLGLAQALHFDSQFKDAITYYEKIVAIAMDNPKGRQIKQQALLNIESCKYGLQNPPNKNSRKWLVRNVGGGINTVYPEFLPVVDPDNSTLLYTTKRNITPGDKKDGLEDKLHGDMYIATRLTGKFESGLPFFKQNYQIKFLENTNDNDDVISMSGNGKYIIIYRGDQLYLSEKKDGVWSAPVILPSAINTNPKTDGHACITNDGKIIYFSAVKAGGFGGKDLYKSVLTENGIWAEPENLGEDINTAEDEDGPYLNASETSFFYSSKGLSGYGGYDIYRSKMNKSSIGKPVNMELPVNSPADDIYYSMNADETEGYLASARKGGYGDMDIYRVFYFGKTTTGSCIPITNSNTSGNVYIDFTLRDSVFVNDSVTFDAKASSIKKGQILNYFWKVNDTLVVSDTAAFTHKFSREGKYTISLEAATFSDTSDYRAEYCVSKDVYVFNPKAVDVFFEPLVQKNEDKLSITGTVDVATMKIDSSKKEVLNIKLEPVYFNTDKFDLRKDALAAIKRNIAKMKVDPTIIVKLTARTDARATREYNLALSQKRANSVVAFLEKNGIKKKRIIAVLALGEAGANTKACNGDADCLEKIYQKNRRVEFKIVGAEYEAPKIARAKKPTGKKPPVGKTKKKK